MCAGSPNAGETPLGRREKGEGRKEKGNSPTPCYLIPSDRRERGIGSSDAQVPRPGRASRARELDSRTAIQVIPPGGARRVPPGFIVIRRFRRFRRGLGPEAWGPLTAYRSRGCSSRFVAPYH